MIRGPLEDRRGALFVWERIDGFVKREAVLVSREDLWLGLGLADSLARLGCHASVCGFPFGRCSCALAQLWTAYVRWLFIPSDRCTCGYMLGKGRATFVALG